MNAPPESPSPAGGIPRTALFGGGAVLLLVLALVIGVQIGDAQVAAEAEDPVETLLARARQLEGQVRSLTPDLLGVGPMGTPAELDEAREGLAALRARSDKSGISLDLTDAQAALVRAEFERALRQRDLDRAQRVVDRFAGRPEGLILDARLTLARGDRPVHEPLRVLARSNNAQVAEAARILISHLRAEEDPDEALEMLREGVRPAAAAAARARALLFKAVRASDPEALEQVLPRLDGPETRRRAAILCAEAGARVATTRPVDADRFERIVRCLLLLGGAPIREEEASRRFVREVVARASERQAASRGAQDDEAAVLLLERLAATGLRCPPTAAAARLIDAAAARPVGGEEDATRRARLLAALVLLDVRLDDEHLAGVPRSALDRLPKGPANAYLAGRLVLAGGEGDAAAARTALRELASGVLGKELGPIHRAHALLAGCLGLALTERAPLVRKALALDHSSPWVRLALARTIAEEGDPAKALNEAEGAHVLFDKQTRDRFAEDAARIRFYRRLAVVHALRRDEALADVFLKKLSEAGDPRHDELSARVSRILQGQ